MMLDETEDCTKCVFLLQVEDAMRLAVKVILFRCFEESKSPKKDKWVKDFPGQCGITLVNLSLIVAS